MSNTEHVKAQQAFSRWLEGNPDRRPTPEEMESLRLAEAMDAGNQDAQALFTGWLQDAVTERQLETRLNVRIGDTPGSSTTGMPGNTSKEEESE